MIVLSLQGKILNFKNCISFPFLYSDSVTYNFSIKHDITSTQTANDISLDVFLPYYVTFKMADTENFEVIVDDEKVQIKVCDLHLDLFFKRTFRNLKETFKCSLLYCKVLNCFLTSFKFPSFQLLKQSYNLE